MGGPRSVLASPREEGLLLLGAAHGGIVLTGKEQHASPFAFACVERVQTETKSASFSSPPTAVEV